MSNNFKFVDGLKAIPSITYGDNCAPHIWIDHSADRLQEIAVGGSSGEYYYTLQQRAGAADSTSPHYYQPNNGIITDNIIKEEHSTGANKDTAGKVRLDLIPPEVILAYGEILTMGATKYADRNWEKGLLLVKHHLGAAQRHINKWQLGIDKDEESGYNHMEHAMWHLAAIVTQLRRGRTDLDDRTKS